MLALGAGVPGALLQALAGPTPAVAHGFERPFPLPVPLWLYLVGAAAAVGASFVVVALAVRAPGGPPRYPVVGLPRVLSEAASTMLAVLGLLWWIGTIAAGLLGVVHMFAPAVFFWVLLWVGVPIVSAVIGNPWPALSPFRTLFSAYEGAARLLGARPFRPPFTYPAGLSRWPAVALLLATLALEFVIPGSYDARQIGTALLAYTGLTLFGMLLFGHTWLRNAELFEVLFGWFGRIGFIGRRAVSRALCAGCPEGCRPERCIDCPDCTAARSSGEQAAVVRPWFSALADVQGGRWSDAAFILLALAGVSYDGLRETVIWGSFVGLLFNPLEEIVGPLNTVIAVDGLGLIGLWLAFLAVFALAVRLTQSHSGAAPLSEVAGAYASSLLPIAAGYLIAHYFTLVVQGVVWLPDLLTDERSVAPDTSWIPSAVIWYVSVAAIVLGHIVAVVLAHRLALAQRARRPIVAGLPLVVVMLGYTVFSLWIIAQPLTAEPIDQAVDRPAAETDA